MTDYTELVKALRHCMTKEDGITICEPCPYYGKGIECENVLHTDAAAAIEALRKRLVSALTALHLANEKMGYYGIQPYTEVDGEDMISDWVKTLVHEELKQQLPKRGEWINHKDEHQCSVCRETVVVDEIRWEQIGAYDYCPNCGAKMEVQDDD